MATIPAKPRRKRAVLIGSIIALCLAGICLWLAVIGPYVESRQRIALATRFLDAYVRGDCAAALAFLRPAQDLLYSQALSPEYTDPATFCTDSAVRIVQSSAPRDWPITSDLESLGGEVTFDGIFLLADPNGDTYPCPQLSVRVERRQDRLVVMTWDQRWARSLERPYSCARLLSLDASSSGWPGCSERQGIARRLNIFDGSPIAPYPLETGMPGVALTLTRINDSTIEVAADGLQPQGVHYIFFAVASEQGRLPGQDFRGVVPFYTLDGKTFAFAGGRGVEMDPWMTGRFTYRIENLPTFPAGSALEVSLVHPGGVVCGSLPAQ